MRARTGVAGLLPLWRVVLVWTVLLTILMVVSETMAAMATRALAGIAAVAGWALLVVRLVPKGAAWLVTGAALGALTAAWCGLVAFGCYVMFGVVEAIAIPGVVLVVLLWLVRGQVRRRVLFAKVAAGEDLNANEIAQARRLGRSTYDLVALLMRHKRVQRAIELLEGVAPPPPLNYYWRVEGRLRLADEVAARAALETLGAMATEEARGLALVAAARLATYERRPGEALKHLSKLAADPDRWIYIDVAQADALVALGRVEEARPVLQQALKRAGEELWRDVVASGRPCAALADAAVPYR